jgi:hypothetical protein
MIALAGDAKELPLRWEESGGPAVTAPPTLGYGASLIEQTLWRLDLPDLNAIPLKARCEAL